MSKRNLIVIALLALCPTLFATALSTTAAVAATPTTSTPPPTSTIPRAPATSQVPTTIASTASKAGVTVTRPQTGDTIVNTGLEIVGTAPPAWLVSVSIVDTDLARTEIQHQPNGRVDGSVTSDASGHWVFVPQVAMTPGSFEVSASYIAPDNQTVDSPGVKFVVVNESGESSIPSSTMWWKIAVAVLALIAVAIVVFRKVRHRRPPAHPAHGRPHLPRFPGHGGSPAPSVESKPLFMSTTDGLAYQRNQAKKMLRMEDEMRVIQRALADSAEALERSNRAITALHRQIRDEYSATSSEHDVEAGSDVPKRHATKRSAGHRVDESAEDAAVAKRHAVTKPGPRRPADLERVASEKRRTDVGDVEASADQPTEGDLGAPSHHGQS